MGRRFITAHDVDDLAAAGSRELRLDAGTRLTDLARERARDHGIDIIAVGAAPVQPGPSSPAAAATGTPSAAPRPDPDEPSRRALRAAVRAGVVEEFGGTPEGLDAALGRVFDRLGISG